MTLQKKGHGTIRTLVLFDIQFSLSTLEPLSIGKVTSPVPSSFSRRISTA